MLPNNFNRQRWSYLFFKRAFDIVASSVILLLLSPVFLLVAILIKLESPGPVFYTSRRVGRYYRIFDFYKFRSMRTNSDSLLEKMKSLNHYGGVTVEERNPDAIGKGYANPAPMRIVRDKADGNRMLFSDNGWVDESDWLAQQSADVQKTFVKFQNDPRITRVGQFIRNTSIDELPQLFNVLKGDMSLVGNRPLPLYEAEKLTTDADVERFFAPAGITGLWQVTERGKKATSSNSRKNLDVQYAQKCSTALDLWILFRTPVAAFQTENV